MGPYLLYIPVFMLREVPFGITSFRTLRTFMATVAFMHKGFDTYNKIL